ncbi:TetR family transcriptional regulator [Stutzerimonas kirkiae]|uniref:TetR family transcriptional regulator n=1 Tax=Stutzerimonas kirkiae TaxID=2211392 RepID=A0A4Q9RF03_9GAMM|nr:TetR family transcriptional regulator [Stutzerimonas kirkiae]TBU99771.1 TetR family transcriptional regulator [Stutzerimonas kirkiae]TBV05297.1 TetR family transcriptional regulator [Stutzerimonas kirkiae]TBV11731.1 TetR family transcriptional regulator [Stutzerimonas kirkiae]TBV15340.1 TetR family transcriptional regulator [Stutzerimonas kirkiae]
MRRTKEEAEKTRISILEAAERLFLDKGVAHTSLDQIARDAGVTRGAVYWHFQNKAHLFNEMVNQVRLPPEQLAQRLLACGPHQPLTVLRDMCIEVTQSMSLNPQKSRIFTILLHRCEFTDELREAEERHNAFIDEFIRLSEQLLQRATEHLRPGLTPRLAALSVHALIVGLVTDWTRNPDQFDPVEDAPLMIDTVFRGLAREWPIPSAQAPTEQ